MSVLVTGASGFVGAAVCRELLARGVAVHALVGPNGSRRHLADIEGSLTLIECDLLGQLPSLPTGADAPTACIHCAWFVQPDRYLTALENLEWMQRSLQLFQALVAGGCGRIVGVGTCFEYQPALIPLSEQATLAPTTLYAAAKAATFLSAEALLRQLGASFAWARLFYVYGPHEHPIRLVSAVALALLEGRTVELTHGRQIRDYLHVADVAAGLVALAQSDVAGAVNIGSDYPATVREVAGHIGRSVGRSELLQFGARAERAGDPPFVVADSHKLRDTSGWSPRFDLAQGLDDTVSWWREHGRRSPA